MAQTKSAGQIICSLVLICLLAGGSAAASKEDIKKYPPVSGEIYGNAAPGVRSISVNGKPVKIGAEQSFVTTVDMKAGEKYLMLKINYAGLTIIKKYLILRRAAVKKFTVFVAKENIEKLAEQEKMKKKTIRVQKPPAKMTAEQERWLASVSSPKFFHNEFKGFASLESLSRAISKDQYSIALKSKPGTLEWLNEILAVPNLYDLMADKTKVIIASERLKRLIAETAAYRNKKFSRLNPFEQKKILLLNRLLIETLYRQAPVRAAWQIPVKPTAYKKPKVYEYLYVWEFSEGKLLIVKQTRGKYSAIIHIPVSKEWMDVKGLSAQDLEDLMGKQDTVPSPKAKKRGFKPAFRKLF